MTFTKERSSEPGRDPKELDLEQKDAIKSFMSGQNVLIEAPPGTGKTFVGVVLGIVSIRKDLLPSHGKVLFLTFSKNARVQIERQADELVSQRKICQEERRRFEIANYHSFFFDCVRHRKGLWGVKTPLRLCSLSERSGAFGDLVKRASLSEAERWDADLLSHALALNRFGAERVFGAAAKGCPLELIDEAVEMAIRYVRDGRPHYDDFAPLMLDLLESSPSFVSYLRAKFPVVILDEFQDTDLLQWQILSTWRPTKLAVLYDRFQMIYEWRGSTLERVADLKSTLGPFEEYGLRTNHRASKAARGLTDFLMALRQDNLGGESVRTSSKQILSTWLRVKAMRRPTDAIGRPIDMPTARRCTFPVASRLKECIDNKESVAVITRGNDLARRLYRILSTKPKPNAVPRPFFRCRMIGTDDTCDELFREWIGQLRSIDSIAGLAGWLGTGVDILLGGEKRISVQRSRRESKIVFRSLVKQSSKPSFKSLNQLLPIARKDESFWSGLEPTIASMAKSEASEIFARFGERMEGMLSLATAVSEHYGVTCDPDRFYLGRALVKAAKNFSKAIDSNEAATSLENTLLKASFLALRRTSNAPTFLCAHQSKGREFDHVIIPWLAGVPEDARGGYEGTNQFCEMTGDSARDNEELRLFYVALSRAKKNVTIFFPEESPSPILERWGLDQMLKGG